MLAKYFYIASAVTCVGLLTQAWSEYRRKETTHVLRISYAFSEKPPDALCLVAVGYRAAACSALNRSKNSSHTLSCDGVPRYDCIRLMLQMEYIAADGYGFDYVMVFKLDKVGVISDYATETVKRIMAAGFKVRVYFSCSKEEVFCEMRAPVERLMQYADQVKHM